MNKLSAALHYAELGWSVFPAHNASLGGTCSCENNECSSIGKHPKIKQWRTAATVYTQQINSWWKKWPNANVAIVTGSISKLVILDVDKDKGGFESLKKLEREHGSLPTTRTVLTGGGGQHLFFEAPSEELGNSVQKIGAGLDVRAEGGYIIAPPSDHKSGRVYSWANDEPIAPLPDWLHSLLINDAPPSPSLPAATSELNNYAQAALESALSNISNAIEGSRNHTLNAEAFGLGQLIGAGLLEENSVIPLLQQTAQQIGLQAKEISATIQSGISKGKLHPREILQTLRVNNPVKPINNGSQGEGKSNEKITQSERLVALAQDIELFFSVEEDEAYASFFINNQQLGGPSHLETHRVKSKPFRHFLSRKSWLTDKKIPNAEALQSAINHLAGQARFEGERRRVFLRLAAYEGRFYWDLCNHDWQVVEISETGWRIIESNEAPVRFRRTRGMLPLPHPVRGGNLESLKQFVNYPDNAAWILHATWILAALRADARTFPVLIVNGEQGSAKSTLCKLTRRLIDPNVADLRPRPREDRDLYIAANNSWICGFDNLSGLSRDLSDSLCRIATGAGFGGRELFSDADETLFQVARPVMVNGIDDLADKADLIDRGVFVELPPIPEEERIDEETFWRNFEATQPALLGALADHVSKALRQLPTVQLEKLPRMADFAKWGAAASIGGENAFITAYTGNRTKANQEALRASELADCLIAWFTHGGPITIDLTTLLTELTALCRNRLAAKIGFEPKRIKLPEGWPTTERKLSNELRRCAPNLRRAGIEISDAGLDPHTRKARRTIKRVPLPPNGPDLVPSKASIATESIQPQVIQHNITEALVEGCNQTDANKPSVPVQPIEPNEAEPFPFDESFEASFDANLFQSQLFSERSNSSKLSKDKKPWSSESSQPREVFTI